MKEKKFRRIRFLLLLLLLPSELWASAEWSITIDMTVVKPPCTVNNGNLIEVGFGKVLTNKIDGQQYKKIPVQPGIKCPDVIKSADLKMKITGETTSFSISDGLLKTDNENLGIKIMANDNKFPINTWLPFSWPQQVPTLAVVPVKRDGVELSGGDFKAGAVMNIEYN